MSTKLPPYQALDWPARGEWARREAEKAKEGLKYFDKLLESRPFVTGDQFTMPDITLFAGIYFAQAVALMPAGLPALREWHHRVPGLPAVMNRTGQTRLPGDLARIGK